MKKDTAPDGENGWQVNGEVTAAEIAIEEAIKEGARSLEIRYDRKSARKPRADEVVRGQCGLRSISLKRAAMPHVSF